MKAHERTADFWVLMQDGYFFWEEEGCIVWVKDLQHARAFRKLEQAQEVAKVAGGKVRRMHAVYTWETKR